MFNVLERIDDIEKTISEILRITKPNCSIVIEVPLSGIVSKCFGSKWRFLMPDEHIHIPSISGLKKLLLRNSLKIVGLTRFGSGFTTGMINQNNKIVLDTLAKKFNFGDRGAFLIKRIF
ncbi:MAG TPA: hypothetical protein PK771_10160, partial [Spirochaetota bacterium]|nr:hypothetical protein [Spirochaetota bacterium]